MAFFAFLIRCIECFQIDKTESSGKIKDALAMDLLVNALINEDQDAQEHAKEALEKVDSNW